MSKKAVKIFLAYAAADDVLKDELLKHFALLRRQKIIEIWDMEQLVAGQEIELTVKQQLETSQIIMILLSVDFIASDFCYKIEQMAMEYYEKAGKKPHFIPVLLRPCDILPFYEQLKIVPSNTHAITDVHWHNRDKAFDIVKNEIEHLVKEWYQKKEEKATEIHHRVTKKPTKNETQAQNAKVVEIEQIMNIPTYASLHTPLGINGNILVPNVDKWLALVDKYLHILEKTNEKILDFEAVGFSKAELLLKKASLCQSKILSELSDEAAEIEQKASSDMSFSTLLDGLTDVQKSITSSKKSEILLAEAYQLAPYDLDIMLEVIHLLSISTPFDNSDELRILNQMYHYFQQNPPQTDKERFIHAQMFLFFIQKNTNWSVQDRLNMCQYALQIFQVLQEAFYLFAAKKMLDKLTKEQQQGAFASFFSNIFSNQEQNEIVEAIGKWHIQADLPSATFYQLDLQANGFFVGKKYEYLGKETAIKGRWQFQNNVLTIENTLSLKLGNISEDNIWKAFDEEKMTYDLYKMS